MPEGIRFNTGVGVGLSLIFTSQIFPFMLSSAFTARTIVAQQGERQSVTEDVWIATALSIAFAFVLGYFMHDRTVTIVGTVFSFIVMAIYLWRGELI